MFFSSVLFVYLTRLQLGWIHNSFLIPFKDVEYNQGDLPERTTSVKDIFHPLTISLFKPKAGLRLLMAKYFLNYKLIILFTSNLFSIIWGDTFALENNEHKYVNHLLKCTVRY